MKVIKPFFLGTLGGLIFVSVLVISLYFSPIREFVYFHADPEIADIRSKLLKYRDWLSQADLSIVEKGPGKSDSLQTAQTLAWREYKKWRNHLGDLARLHDRPTAEGFWNWIYALRYWAIPIALFLALLPGLGFAWRARNRYRPARSLPRSLRQRDRKAWRNEKVEDPMVQDHTLSSFQDAIKKIAKISDSDSQSKKQQPQGASSYIPPTAPIPVASYQETTVIETLAPASEVDQEPETKPIPIFTESGLKTDLLQSSSVWGDGGSASPSNASALSMEDEDGEDSTSDGKGFLPPTTELEKVERRKEQVLKLARKGMTSSEISRRMRISQDQVEFIIRLRREKG